MKDIKTTTMRLSEQTITDFRSIAEKEGFTHEQCLSSLINAFTMQNAKGLIKDRKKEIEIFEEYINRLQNLYLSSLESNMTSEEVIREEFKEQIVEKDKIIMNLNKSISEFKEKELSHKENFDEIKKQVEDKNAALKAYDAVLNQNKLQISQLTKEKDDIFEKLKGLNEYIDENKNLKTTLKEFEIEKLKHSSALEEKEFEISRLKDQLSYSNEKYEALNNQITNLKDDYKNELKELKSELQAEKKEALEELRKDLERNYSANLELEKRTVILEKEQQIAILKSKLALKK